MYSVCDPLYGYISLSDEEQQVIDHPYFQRLRFIYQLGFVQYAYPSAINNRFVHSIGVCYLAGRAFDSIFSKDLIKKLNISDKKKKEFRKVLKLAALLHDIGHGPLSHVSETFMPQLKSLNIQNSEDRRARHEDYTFKIIMDSPLSQVIKSIGVDPLSVVSLLYYKAEGGEDFFNVSGVNCLPLLKQIISSYVDVDRMDYIHRDSHFCGVHYGIVDWKWILSHFNCHEKEGKLYLAINKQALWTLESFLLGRQHMHLAVYFHSKPVVYEQMLKKYAEETGFLLPSDVEPFTEYVDSVFFETVKKNKDNEWAKRILNKKTYERLYEYSYFHSEGKDVEKQNLKDREQFYKIKDQLEKSDIPFFEANSYNHMLRPSKDKEKDIYIKNVKNNSVTLLSEEQSLFNKSERRIERIYVHPSHVKDAKKFLDA